MMSSEMFLHPGRPVRIFLIDSWKISDAALIPNGRRLYLLRDTDKNLHVGQESGFVDRFRLG